jgi:transposase-like protein
MTLPGMASPTRETRTRIDVDAAAVLYKKGWTLRRIAAHQQCSFQRLSTLLRRRSDVQMRTPAHPRALRLSESKQEAIRAAIRKGANGAEISRQVQVTPSTVARLAEREQLPLFKGKRLSWDVERARQLRAENASYERIAAELGVAAMTVWRKLNPASGHELPR